MEVEVSYKTSELCHVRESVLCERLDQALEEANRLTMQRKSTPTGQSVAFGN